MLFRAFRVHQWPKNLVVFAALVFAQQLTFPAQIMRSILAFVLFCAASSAVYLFNDLFDIEKDRSHPEKRSRPLASGALSVSTAITLMVALAVASLAVALFINLPFGGALGLYIAINLLYTLALKNLLIIDVLTVAMGFVIRAVAGAIVLRVSFSNWLVVCALFLALFLSLGKRRRELEVAQDDPANHRAVLGQYSIPFLDTLIMIMGASTLIVYVIYTSSPEVIERLGTSKLYFTVPFVVYGLFRYLYLVEHRSAGGDPSKTLLEDAPLLATVLLWGLASVSIIYAGTGR